eukprot:TRINITY_DN391_c0_g1_i2.p1 TRINITY_DN391_c0_g1~~TRINITY_DN391_c0_g1_i2.p1  ORF type:complete len:593 (+),score=147.01 TRINITY_DN391_c0_g1_i2:120-1781(+)
MPMAVIVPSSDAHMSEYVAECDKRRAWLSGFSGSAGTAVIMPQPHKSALWTDGRYFLQASKQLDLSVWELMKDGLPTTLSIPAAIAQTGATHVAADPRTLSLSFARQLEHQGLSLVPLSANPVDAVWQQFGRPARNLEPIVSHDIEFAGTLVSEKLALVREKLSKASASALVVCALDEVAWLLNLRGSDVLFNPVFFAFVVITAEKCFLFVHQSQLSSKVADDMKADVGVVEYDEFYKFLDSLEGKIWVDPAFANFAVFKALNGKSLTEQQSPIQLLKAVKNSAEIAGMRNCHLRDAAAKISFFHWLENNIADDEKTSKHTEIEIAGVLESFRKKQDLFVGLSFESIVGSGPNGAIIHYSPSRTSSRPISRQEMILIDSGGQYRDGTTDVTRTIHMGKPTEFQKQAFTLVLKGHIGLHRAIFPPGTVGPTLDVLARLPLWNFGLNYGHGTGHGVGSFLNVHEGPHGIGSSTRNNSILNTPLQNGMVVTNEPGYYHEGEFGVRIENIMLVKEAETPYKFNGSTFLCFEPLTLVIIVLFCKRAYLSIDPDSNLFG